MSWRNYPCENHNGCISDQGYGLLCINGKKGLKAHVAAWEKVNGKVPDGLVLDHLCRNRACINPEHLEPVTPKENTLRGNGPTAINSKKTHCKNGHALSGENLGPYDYKRSCRICQSEHSRKYKMKKRQEKSALAAVGEA